MVRKHIFVFIAAVAGIGLLLVLTNPEKLPAVIFIVLFLLLYLSFYAGIALLGFVLKHIGLVFWNAHRIKQAAFALACLPVFLLILQSIGQLTVRDVLLACGLFVLLYLYFGRLLAQHPTD